MNTEKETLVVSFPNTMSAIEMRRHAKADGVGGVIIPVPRSMKAGCGMAWAAAPEQEGLVRSCLIRYSIPYEKIEIILWTGVV